MIFTILAIIIAALVHYYPIDFNLIYGFVFASGAVVFFVFAYINTTLLNPLQRLEQKIIPRVMEQFRNDLLWKITRIGAFLFFFFSAVASLAFLSSTIPYKPIIFSIWIFLFGVTLDLIHDSLKRIVSLLNPFEQTALLMKEGISAIQKSNNPNLLATIDDMGEMGLHATTNNKIGLANQTLNLFPKLLGRFFDSVKSISSTEGSADASYAVYYLLQRIELINSKALESHLGLICSEIIAVLGKIIFNCAKFDLSMVTFPVHVMGKFAHKAQQYHYDEVAALASTTLVEVSKMIINEVDLSFAALVEPFEAIINNLDAIAQATFKKDKTIPISLITQPLKDFKALLNDPKIANHRDTPAILKLADAKLAEFEALEQVLKAIPKL